MLLVALATAFGFVFARLRLETGSVWPAIILHAGWNSIIQSGFDAARSGGSRSNLHDDASWWVGESGALTVIAMIIAAIIFSQGCRTIRSEPRVRNTAGTAMRNTAAPDPPSIPPRGSCRPT